MDQLPFFFAFKNFSLLPKQNPTQTSEGNTEMKLVKKLSTIAFSLLAFTGVGSAAFAQTSGAYDLIDYIYWVGWGAGVLETGTTTDGFGYAVAEDGSVVYSDGQYIGFDLEDNGVLDAIAISSTGGNHYDAYFILDYGSLDSGELYVDTDYDGIIDTGALIEYGEVTDVGYDPDQDGFFDMASAQQQEVVYEMLYVALRY
jgi:hypothetical protein